MRRSRGFTLIEIVVAAAIVGLLATMAMPLAERVSLRDKESQLRRGLRDIRTALDAHRDAVKAGKIRQPADLHGYPQKLEDLVDGVPDATDPKGERRIYLMRRMPRDPFFDDAATPAAQTWGLRSYDSPPDAPAAGDDVFDVYSLSTLRGLNGVLYRDW